MDSLFVPLGFKVSSGIYQACWDCAEEIDPGGRPPLEVPFPPPSNPQRMTDDMNYCLFYCGICKSYCRENEQPEAMRILDEDLGQDRLPLFDLSDEPVDPLKPGVYLACVECRDKYKPAIHKRLRGLDLLPRNQHTGEVIPVEELSGSMLL